MNQKEIVLSGVRYAVVVEEGVMVGLRRYHAFAKNGGVWVELRFSAEDSSASQELVSRLSEVYFEQAM